MSSEPRWREVSTVVLRTKREGCKYSCRTKMEGDKYSCTQNQDGGW